MTEDVIKYLPEILKDHTCSLRKASHDKSNEKHMCESKMRIINFDKIPREYAKVKQLDVLPNSNDALYISRTGKWYFIEFKNGRVDKINIFRKIYDSLIMLVELEVISDFKFSRDHIEYILVYNEDKNARVQEAPDREANYAFIRERAQQEKKLFGVDKLERYLFFDTHTYTTEVFEQKFVIPREQEEAASNSVRIP